MVHVRAVENVNDVLNLRQVDVEAFEVLEVLLGVVADEDDVAFWVEAVKLSG